MCARALVRMKLANHGVKKTKSCSAAVSETYKEFAENTSIHGLKYTVKEKIDHHEKLFWVLIVLCGLCGSCYMTMLFWERYTSNPTRTTVLSAYAPTTLIPFPAVTVCNVNKIIVSKVESFIEELDHNGTEKSILKNAFPQLLSFIFSDVIDYNVTELDILQSVLQHNGYDDMAFIMERISQSCEEMLLFCIWNRKAVPCEDIFKKSISYNGVCCSFNYELYGTGEDIYSPSSGLGSGLNVLLDPMLQSVQYSHLYCSGFKIHIHSSSDYLGSQSNSKLLPPGRILYIQVLGTKMTCSQSVKDLSISQRECLYPDEFKLDHFGDAYSDDNCLTECEYHLYFRYCGCVPFYYTFADVPICNISKIPCLSEVRSNQTIMREVNSCNCLPICEDLFYNLFSTSTNFRYNESMSMLSFGDIKVGKDMSLLNVCLLGTGQTILLKDTITSTIYLLSSFGGVYSLFMGCSLITIVEIIYYCLLRFSFKMNAFGRVNVGDLEAEEKRRNNKNKSRRVAPNRESTNSFNHHYYGGRFLP